jgi:hypothetical protein
MLAVPERLDCQRDRQRPQRHTGFRPGSVFTIQCRRCRPRLTPADNTPGGEKVAIIGTIWQRLRRNAAGRRQGRPINGKPATIVMDAAGIRVSRTKSSRCRLQRVPAEGAQGSGEYQPVGIGLLKPGCLARSATAEFTTLARHFAEPTPDTNKQFNTGRRAVDPDIHAPQPRGTLLTMLGFCVGVLLTPRQRHEHAVRARHAPREGAGDPIVARRDTDAADPQSHREPAGRRPGARSASRWYGCTSCCRRPSAPSTTPPAYIIFDVDAIVLR